MSVVGKKSTSDPKPGVYEKDGNKIEAKDAVQAAAFLSMGFEPSKGKK